MSGKVPPSSRAGKPARSRLATDAVNADVRQAARLYERFSGHDAAEVLRVSGVPLPPKVATVIGELDGVLYTAIRDGKRESYIHKFNRQSRPVLAVSPDGRQLLIVGGAYVFGERGIVDRKGRKI